MSLRLGCGQCIGCRLEKSRQWAVRCLHEASLYESSCMVTLTYDDEHLPLMGSLDRRAVPLFLKRLRKATGPFRYFQVGEYGELTMRPHYHALLFGKDFADKVRVNRTEEYPEWTSETLESTWGSGRCLIGSVTFESAAYVARYVTKKVTGRDAVGGHYELVDTSTGEVHALEPEYGTMSRRPGLGKGWYERFGEGVERHDSVVVRGREAKPPRFYDGLLEERSPFALWMAKRERELARKPENETEDRLVAREAVAKSRLTLKRRSL